MSKGKVYISNYLDNPTEWYWNSTWDSNKEGAETTIWSAGYELSLLCDREYYKSGLKIPSARFGVLYMKAFV